jgi:hypothetical protein
MRLRLVLLVCFTAAASLSLSAISSLGDCPTTEQYKTACKLLASYTRCEDFTSQTPCINETAAQQPMKNDWGCKLVTKTNVQCISGEDVEVCYTDQVTCSWNSGTSKCYWNNMNGGTPHSTTPMTTVSCEAG